MIIPTIQIGHPILRTPAKAVTLPINMQVKTVVENLIETMREVKLIGMAAPQIGEGIQVFITEPRQTETRPADQADELRVYINPRIIEYSKEECIIYEGCGSVAKGSLFGPVSRPRQVTVEAYNLNGEIFQLTADGILGRVIQHEYDHLHGRLFTDILTDPKELIDREFYKEIIKSGQEQLENSRITNKEYRII